MNEARTTGTTTTQDATTQDATTRVAMDDPRWQPGMPVLDRQAPDPDAPRPAGTPQAPVPRSVPETRPTRLQDQYVYLSAIVFLCGLVAISALELGASPSSPVVKLPVLIGAPVLIVTTADAILRIWRSAWAWMPVNRGRGLFRLAWVAVAAVGLVALVWGAVLVLTA